MFVVTTPGRWHEPSLPAWVSGVPATPWTIVVQELAAERGMQMGELEAELTLRKKSKASVGTYRQARAGARSPTRELFAELADILGVKPDVFDEYRLILVRDQLDDRVVGLDAAVELLEAIQAATQTAAVAESRRAGEQPSTSDRPKRASGRGRPKAQGA